MHLLIKTLLGATLALGAGVSHAAKAPSRPVAASPSGDIAKLAWLAGCWQGPGAAPRYQEKWIEAAGTLVGTSHGMQDGKYGEFEFAQLRLAEPGQLAYVTKAPGGAAVYFNLLGNGKPNEFIFANIDNDFPSRIIYRKGGADSVNVSVIGTLKGKLTTVNNTLTRGRCEGK